MEQRHLLSYQDSLPTGPPYPQPMFPQMVANYPPAYNTHHLQPPANAPVNWSSQNPNPAGCPYPQVTVPLIAANIPPPCNPQHPQTPANPPAVNWNVLSISPELAKEVFLEYAASDCWYSSKPAEEMVITDLCPVNTYRYQLETFTESRSTEWAKEPYNGQFVDGHSGIPPAPWEMAVSAPPLFHDSKKQIKIPYSSTVKNCDNCRRLGKVPCGDCRKTGVVKCSPCGGSGRIMSPEQEQVTCKHCTGRGKSKCKNCGGAGHRNCKVCKGKGQLLCYVNLNITWENHSELEVIDRSSGLPVNLLKSVAGEKLFTDMNTQVFPVTNFPDDAVNNASKKAVREHNARFSTTCRIMQQRQTIDRIPVTRVHYTWREKSHIYFVYGVDHKVYAKEYPAGCGCCVMF